MFTFDEWVEFSALLLVVVASLCALVVALRDLGWIGHAPKDYQPRRASALSLPENVIILAKIVLLIIVTRMVIFSVAHYAYVEVNDKALNFLGHFRDIWLRWDSYSYLHIAEHGYPTKGDKQALIVYYPLYPIMIKAVQLIVQNYFYAGIIVSMSDSTNKEKA